MAEVIELDGVDSLRAGAVGKPGERVFVLEAVKGADRLSVLLEKEQIALLAAEATQFLDKLAEEFPEDRAFVDPSDSAVTDPPEPLFRARLIGLGFDPDRELVLVELREEAPDDDEDEEAPSTVAAELGEGFVARLFATRAQVRAMVSSGAEAVQAGRARWN